ncbi:hypothetical protein C2S53_007882 [Perilla frutescens var. hirtella]|uniref:Phorbol-ester/DAG-type domain-containing protein n=1 Tax=Perilla frutescens var. hirtella TaxID=608512 RepID=A0AAD4J5H4_PERFH|nr:hypothetical protein C2S53_007882 [Perilla frutescens var. hirtella]
MEEEEVVVDHWSHHHPLSLVQTSKRAHFFTDNCYGCDRSFSRGEHVYGCSKKCKYVKLLHEECAEMSRKIRHPMHPQHILIQKNYSSNESKCAICERHIDRSIGYKCTSSDCEFEIHMRCAQDRGVMEADDDTVIISHPSHPQHPLVRVSRRPCSLRYVAHVKCARVNPIHLTLPINDVVEEQIKPFVKRGQKEQDQILVNVKYKFHHHKHELSLISPSSSEETSSDDDEECGKKSELICDGCITPIIYEKKHTSSSSSSSYMSCSECKYFLHMACFQLPPELPSLPLHHKVDHSLILKSFAKLDFWKSCIVCGLYMNGLYYACTKSSCEFIADIKCASLLDPVYHFAHPRHLLNHLSVEDMKLSYPSIYFRWVESFDDLYYYVNRLCDTGCGETAANSDCYVSGSRDFVAHVRCAALPPSVTDRRWDEHPLMLTYFTNDLDVSYCDKCEGEMNPRSWMYHCRHCDSSFHPDCFPTISGKYRNIKFGQKYDIATAHPHPLTYHLLTLKRRCDVCHLDKLGERGFQCASCYFFICLDQCGKKMIEQGHIQTAD